MMLYVIIVLSASLVAALLLVIISAILTATNSRKINKSIAALIGIEKESIVNERFVSELENITKAMSSLSDNEAEFRSDVAKEIVRLRSDIKSNQQQSQSVTTEILARLDEIDSELSRLNYRIDASSASTDNVEVNDDANIENLYLEEPLLLDEEVNSDEIDAELESSINQYEAYDEAVLLEDISEVIADEDNAETSD